MMRTIKMLTVTLASLAALAAPAVMTAPVADASVISQTVVYGFGPGCPALHSSSWAHPMVRPGQAHFGFSCEVGIHRIRWQDWRRLSASGHGSFLLFTGFGFQDRPATIALSNVLRHNGQRYFSHLIIVWTSQNGSHHKLVFNWRHNATMHIWLWE
jgi:hypothetical protein